MIRSVITFRMARTSILISRVSVVAEVRLSTAWSSSSKIAETDLRKRFPFSFSVIRLHDRSKSGQPSSFSNRFTEADTEVAGTIYLSAAFAKLSCLALSKNI